MNNVNLIGNLTHNPELKQTASGTAVLQFGIAVNDRIKNKKTNQWENYPNFFDCTLFGIRAESLANILYKGFKVGITGKLHYSSWQRQDGSKASKVEIMVDNIDFCQSTNNNSQSNLVAGNGIDINNNQQDEYAEDDIPF